ncbi:hypothetical protein AAKU55_004896 [Oxalobacteraceae bacterium GrIS 1.11]
METSKLDAFMTEWMKTHEAGVLPGAMLMKYGPQDYIGATLTVRGTLYFKGSHTPEVREAICQCFDAYEVIAKEHLTWLWRAEPPEGPDQLAYRKTKPMRDMMKRMKESDLVSFAYIGGIKPEDASPWQFYVSGHRAWQAKMGTWGLDMLQFSLPLPYVEEHPTAFQQLFLNFARLLKAEHGHGGYAFNLSIVRDEPNEPIEAFMTSKMNSLDAGDVSGRQKIGITDHIKTVSWLTAINKDMLKQVGGLSALRSELPMDWFAKYDYGNGIVIQAGPKPEKAAVEIDPKPAIYVLPNMALKDIRVSEIGSLHYGSKDGEPRLFGWTAEQWLVRFDVQEGELLSYKAKLLKEPKLSKETTLPDRL